MATRQRIAPAYSAILTHYQNSAGCGRCGRAGRVMGWQTACFYSHHRSAATDSAAQLQQRASIKPSHNEQTYTTSIESVYTLTIHCTSTDDNKLVLCRHQLRQSSTTDLASPRVHHATTGLEQSHQHGIAFLTVHVLHRRSTVFALMILRPNCFRGLLQFDLLMYSDPEVPLPTSR